jgi:hypothetical protein
MRLAPPLLSLAGALFLSIGSASAESPIDDMGAPPGAASQSVGASVNAQLVGNNPTDLPIPRSPRDDAFVAPAVVVAGEATPAVAGISRSAPAKHEPARKVGMLNSKAYAKKKITHRVVHRVVPIHAPAPDVRVAALAPPKCNSLACPRFILIGVGY